jgi:mRNA interferase RelE/StbE
MKGALYGFAYSGKALAYLKTMPQKIRRQIINKIQTLAANPTPSGSKQLHGITDGGAPVHRLRSGDYRVLYLIKNSPQQIVVLDIDNRKDVYR